MGDIITYHIPFSGTSELLNCRSLAHSAVAPTGKVVGSELTKSYRNMVGVDDDTDTSFERDLLSLQNHLEQMRSEIEAANGRMPAILAKLVEVRRQREQAQSTAPPPKYPSRS
jgi:hypothetical protein